MQDLILDHETVLIIEPDTGLMPAGGEPVRIRCENYEGTEPNAVLTVIPWAGEPPLTVTVTMTGSNGEKMILDWGDGESLGPVALQNSISHAYTAAGQYVITLKIGIGDVWAKNSWPVFCFTAGEITPEPPANDFFTNFIDKATEMATQFRNRFFLIDAVYSRNGEERSVKISPGKPETPGLDFDRETAYLDATEFFVPLEQPTDCLQFIEDKKIIFKPAPGDLIRYQVGVIETVKRVAERGNGPCWDLVFGHRELRVYVEQYRK